MKDPDLWRRLADHNFPLDDKGETLRSHVEYATTLDAEKTLIVLQEYRRFLYLAAVSPQAATPSPVIDGIWRLHVNHTRAYFDDFSPRIIGRAVPLVSGRGNLGKDPAYARTLDLYQAEFGEVPPGHIWPRPEVLRRGVGWSNLSIALLCGIFILAAVAIGDLTGQLVAVAVALIAVWVVVDYLITASKGYWTLKNRYRDDGTNSGFSSGNHYSERRDRDDRANDGDGRDNGSGDGGGSDGGGGD